MRPRLPATLLAFGLGTLLSACAGGPPPAVTPDQIPALESESKGHPTDPELMTRLGVAYYEAKEYGRARDVLNSSQALDKTNYSTLVYLGLTYEELGQLDSARVSYNTASPLAKNETQRNELTNRLALLTRKELHQAARQALAQEAALSNAAPTENAIAVLPVRYVGSDTTLRPLERGVTHLIITDLSKVGRLRLLERERVQALVDEMQLSDEGRVDPATGARSGRMLRAASVVQGSLQDVPATGQLKLDANVVNTSTSSIAGHRLRLGPIAAIVRHGETGGLSAAAADGHFADSGRAARLSERPTADLQAFLAFSNGLAGGRSG